MVLQRYLLLGLLGLLSVVGTAAAKISDYGFSVTGGVPTDMTGATQRLAANLDDVVAGPFDIGFNFNLDGTVHSQFSVSSNGFMKLGSTTPPSNATNDINGSGSTSYPLIAPFWDDLRTYQPPSGSSEAVGYVRSKVTGAVGSRVLTVEWRVRYWNNEASGPWVFQARLHERDGRIELLYVNTMNNFAGSGSIGLADVSSDYASVTPSTGSVSYTVENSSISLSGTPITAGTMYVFSVCPSINYIGDEDEGGTADMSDGDVLFEGRKIDIRNSITHQPFRIENNKDNLPFPVPTRVQIVLDDPDGYFTLVGGDIDTVLQPGQSVIPTIKFDALQGAGRHTAELFVFGDCGARRTFNLEYIIDAPAGEFTSGPNQLGPNADLFPDVSACVADDILSIPIFARNTGIGTLYVHNSVVFLTDTGNTDGTSRFPLLRDEEGNLIRTTEYFLSRSAGSGPVTGDTGIAIPEGGQTVLFLNFRAPFPGRRTGRVWIWTNASNFTGNDTLGQEQYGLISFDVFGRGISAEFAGLEGLRKPKPMVMGALKIGESATDTFTFVNGGECNLRVKRNAFRFETGDVEEFEVVGHVIDGVQSGNDYILAPGDTGSVIVRFTPSRSGSRRATMRLVTNDSSLVLPGLTERGVFYWEAYGEGKAGLETADLMLTPAVIDAESSTGEIVLANEFTTIVEIDSIRLVGDAEIMEDPANRWPTTPHIVLPGTKISLGIHFSPAPGSEDGDYEAEVLVFLRNGDTVRARISGYAGTRKLLVAPTDLFEGTTLKTGEVLRRFFTVTNTGTLPVTITSMDLTGDGAADYTLSPLRRATLLPGRTEYIEVTYAPSDANPDDAAITIVSNATNGDQMITLSGDGMEAGTVRDGDGGATRGISGVEMEVVSGGLALGQSMPNPARGATEIRYRVAKEGEVRLALYDGQGRLVRVLDAGRRVAGEHVVRVEVKDLSSGEYHYRLEQGSDILTRRMVVRK